MKIFELTLVVRNDDFEVRSINKVEADDLVQLYAQLLLMTAQIMRDLTKDQPELMDDDIPF